MSLLEKVIAELPANADLFDKLFAFIKPQLSSPLALLALFLIPTLIFLLIGALTDNLKRGGYWVLFTGWLIALFVGWLVYGVLVMS